jgi:hypothetical protein
MIIIAGDAVSLQDHVAILPIWLAYYLEAERTC